MARDVSFWSWDMVGQKPMQGPAPLVSRGRGGVVPSASIPKAVAPVVSRRLGGVVPSASIPKAGVADLPLELFREVVGHLPVGAHFGARQVNRGWRANMDGDSVLRGHWDSMLAAGQQLFQMTGRGSLVRRATATALFAAVRAGKGRPDTPEHIAHLQDLWDSIDSMDAAPDAWCTLPNLFNPRQIESILEDVLDALNDGPNNVSARVHANLKLRALAPHLNDVQAAQAVRALFAAKEPMHRVEPTVHALSRGRVGEAFRAAVGAYFTPKLAPLDEYAELIAAAPPTGGRFLSRVVAAAWRSADTAIVTAARRSADSRRARRTAWEEQVRLGAAIRLLVPVAAALEGEHFATALRICAACQEVRQSARLLPLAPDAELEVLYRLWPKFLAKATARAHEVAKNMLAALPACLRNSRHPLSSVMRRIAMLLTFMGPEALKEALSPANFAADSAFVKSRLDLLLTQTGLGEGTGAVDCYVRAWPDRSWCVGPWSPDHLTMYSALCHVANDFAPFLTVSHSKLVLEHMIASLGDAQEPRPTTTIMEKSAMAFAALTPRLDVSDFRALYAMASGSEAPSPAAQLLLFAYAPASVGPQHFTGEQLAAIDALLGEHAEPLAQVLETAHRNISESALWDVWHFNSDVVDKALQRRFAMLTPAQVSRWGQEAVQRAQARSPGSGDSAVPTAPADNAP